MIAVYLAERRREFLNFAAENHLNFIELFDLSNTEYVSSFDKVFTDAPALVAGAYSVIDISNGDFEVLFRDYCTNKSKEICISKEQLYHVFDGYFSRLRQSNLLYYPCEKQFNIDDFEIKNTAIANVEETTVSINLQRVDIRKQEDIMPTLDFDFDTQTEHESIQQSDCYEEPSVPIEEQQFTEVSRTNFFQQPQPRQQRQSFQETSRQRYRSQPNSDNFNAPDNPSNFFTASSPLALNQTNTVTVRNSNMQGRIRPKGLNGSSRKFTVPIITFSSLTDKAGVSSIAYMISHVLAAQNPTSKILYLDLNVSNPNSIANLLCIDPDTDASVVKISSLSESEFLTSIGLLTETVGLETGSISVITLGQASFVWKRQLVSMDFEHFIRALANSFDMVIVDLGKIQMTLDYQLRVLSGAYARHYLLADGSDNRIIKTFCHSALELPRNYSVILNKYQPQSGAFQINQILQQQPLASISLHRNMEAFVTGRIQFEGSALHKELTSFGGGL